MQPEALRTFLIHKLDQLSKMERSQQTMLATWLTELYLDNINQALPNAPGDPHPNTPGERGVTTPSHAELTPGGLGGLTPSASEPRLHPSVQVPPPASLPAFLYLIARFPFI